MCGKVRQSPREARRLGRRGTRTHPGQGCKGSAAPCRYRGSRQGARTRRAAPRSRARPEAERRNVQLARGGRFGDGDDNTNASRERHPRPRGASPDERAAREEEQALLEPRRRAGGSRSAARHRAGQSAAAPASPLVRNVLAAGGSLHYACRCRRCQCDGHRRPALTKPHGAGGSPPAATVSTAAPPAAAAFAVAAAAHAAASTAAAVASARVVPKWLSGGGRAPTAPHRRRRWRVGRQLHLPRWADLSGRRPHQLLQQPRMRGRYLRPMPPQRQRPMGHSSGRGKVRAQRQVRHRGAAVSARGAQQGGSGAILGHPGWS